MRDFFHGSGDALDVLNEHKQAQHGKTMNWDPSLAIENGHLQLVYLLKMVISHSYVSFPSLTQFG